MEDGAGSDLGFDGLGNDEVDQITKCAMGFKVVAQRFFSMDTVVVPAALFAYRNHATTLQIVYNFLHSPLGNTDICRHVA